MSLPILSTILATLRDCRFSLVHESKKVACFSARSGHNIYIIKGQLRPSNIALAVEPSIDADHLRQLDGEPKVDDTFLHNSNFREFPIRKNNGKNSIHFGRRVRLANSIALGHFLDAYASLEK
jgi:hypothetical protein